MKFKNTLSLLCLLFFVASPVSAAEKLRESIGGVLDEYIQAMERYYANYNVEFAAEKEGRESVVDILVESYVDLWNMIPSEEGYDWLRDAFIEGIELRILNSPAFNIFQRFLLNPKEENDQRLRAYLQWQIEHEKLDRANLQYVLEEGITSEEYENYKKESYEWMRFVIRNTRTLFKENKVYLSYWDLNYWSDIRFEDFDMPIATQAVRPYPFEIAAFYRRVLAPDLHPEINEFFGLQPSSNAEDFFRKFGDAFIDEFYHFSAQEVVGYFREYSSIFGFKTLSQREGFLNGDIAQERFSK
ncbi:MAG: hypothetical protein JJT75_03080 [Opitutales bacterium]|nr:hypothetical protein [Opitutales bacterium]MCH8541737.1 hypothetical protein [Opitutales bacterium]